MHQTNGVLSMGQTVSPDNPCPMCGGGNRVWACEAVTLTGAYSGRCARLGGVINCSRGNSSRWARGRGNSHKVGKNQLTIRASTRANAKTKNHKSGKLFIFFTLRVLLFLAPVLMVTGNNKTKLTLDNRVEVQTVSEG